MRKPSRGSTSVGRIIARPPWFPPIPSLSKVTEATRPKQRRVPDAPPGGDRSRWRGEPGALPSPCTPCRRRQRARLGKGTSLHTGPAPLVQTRGAGRRARSCLRRMERLRGRAASGPGRRARRRTGHRRGRLRGPSRLSRTHAPAPNARGWMARVVSHAIHPHVESRPYEVRA